jgi:hypothetical protein
MHCPVGVALGVADGEEGVLYTPADEEVEMAEYAPEKVDAEPVGVEDGAEEFELLLAKLATDGPGNVY